DQAYRDDAKSSAPTTDTTSGTTTGMNDIGYDSTVSGTTTGAPAAAPATGASTTTAPTTGTANTTAPAPGAGTDTMATGTTPDTGTKTATAPKKKSMKKMDKKSGKTAEPAKTDSSSNEDFSGAGAVAVYGNDDLRDEAGTEVADPNDASMSETSDLSTESPIDDDASVSGVTSSPDSTSATAEQTAPAVTDSSMSTMSSDTQSVSTTSAGDEDLKAAAKMAGSLSPWYTEPYSRIPTHVGSTGLSGKDKSVASVEPYSVFIDPPALERAIHTRDTIRPVSEIDFNSFGYDRRARFSSQMNTRLESIDSRLDILESKAHVSANERQVGEQLSTIKNDHLALENQLDGVRKVDESEWTSFRDGFRDRLTALDREVARLSVSMR
ncbi:MAG: hypothetical protein AAB250_12405, partial [Bdellovibrionota bacterium]